MKLGKHPLLVLGLEVVGILVLHAMLLHWLAGTNVVATLFSPGGHVQILNLAVAGTFLAVRVVAILLLPGIILGRLGLFLLERWHSKTVKPSNGAGQATATEP